MKKNKANFVFRLVLVRRVWREDPSTVVLSNTWIQDLQEARERGLVSPRMYDDFGFFRDRHLFFSAVNVSPSQVWEISDVIECIRWTLKLRHTRTDPLDYSVPGAVSQYFPRSDYSTSDFGTLVEAVAYRGREEDYD